MLSGSLPWRGPLNVFLILSSARRGSYAGKILIVNQQTDKVTRYAKFVARFDDESEMIPLGVDLGECEFVRHGAHNFEIYFAAPNGGEALKAEHPFHIAQVEE